MAISASLGESRVLRLEAGAVAYRDTGGAGRPVLFVHGVLVNADLWRAVVPALGADFRCIAPDWPLGGHEFAMAPQADLTPPGLARSIVEFADRLDLRQPILVSSDTGTALAQIAFARRPERFGGFVITNGDAYEEFFPAPLSVLPPVARLPGAVALLAPGMRTKLGGRLLALTLAHRPIPEAIMRSYLGATANREVRRDLAKVLGAVDNRHTLEAASHFPAIARPVAVGWGEDDLFFRRSIGARLARGFGDATLRRIPRCRTLVPEDAPLDVAELVREVAARAS